MFRVSLCNTPPLLSLRTDKSPPPDDFLWFFFFFNTYYACLSHGLSQRRLWSSGHMICAPLNPPNHPARSQLCFPNPINIFYALSSFASPNIYLSPSSLFFLFPTLRSHSAIIWPQALLSSVSFKLPLRLIALTTSYTLSNVWNLC